MLDALVPGDDRQARDRDAARDVGLRGAAARGEAALSVTVGKHRPEGHLVGQRQPHRSIYWAGASSPRSGNRLPRRSPNNPLGHEKREVRMDTYGMVQCTPMMVPGHSYRGIAPMTSLHGFVRRLALTIIGTLTLASAGYTAQPPNVVVSDESANTAMGTGALFNLPEPSGSVNAENTAAGYSALFANAGGYFNSAFGAYSLTHNTQGYHNTAFGAQTLNVNTEGRNNTAVGAGAMSQNEIGIANTATGDSALYENRTGSYNTAAGGYALGGNTTGSNNTAYGYEALGANDSGTYNIATGSRAMAFNATGSYNTAVGVNALGTNQGGSNNIAVGVNAGYYIRGSRYNIDIGNVGAATDVGLIRLGTSGQQTATYIAGIANAHVTGSAVYITSTGQLGVIASSERYKTAVAPMGSATGRLKELRPVTFRLKADSKAGRQYGLIAEEVAKVYPELVIRNESGQAEGVRYEELTPMLLNEVQRQQQELAELKEKVAELERNTHR